jgi:hypothetical protein
MKSPCVRFVHPAKLCVVTLQLSLGQQAASQWGWYLDILK